MSFENLDRTTEIAQDDLGSEQLNPQNQTSEVQEIETQADTVEANEVDGSWMQSNEYKNGLWKSPDDLYKSVQFYQKKYSPFEQTVKELGYQSPDELKQAITEYQQSKPDYEKSMGLLQSLNTMIQDPEHGQSFKKAIQEYQIAKEREKYGVSLSELPEQFREQLTAGVEAKEMLEQMQSEKQVQELVSTIDTQVNSISELCGKYSMSLDTQAFLAHCKENQVPAKFLKAYFMENYFDSLVQNAQTSAALGAVNKNGQIKKASVASSQKQAPAAKQPTPSDSKGLLSTLMAKL